MEPINYMPPVLDAFTAGLAGFQQGQQTRANEKNMVLAREQQDLAAQNQTFRQDLLTQENARQAEAFRQQGILFDQGQQDRVAQMAAAEQQAEVDAQTQARFMADQQALVEKMREGVATSADIGAFLAQYPDYSEALKGSFDELSQREREVSAFELARVATALKSNRPEVAIELLEARATAARNSNKTDEAEMTQAMIELIRLDPAGGSTLAAVALQQLDPDLAKTVFGEGEAPTDDMREYEAYAADERAAGRVPLGRLEYQQSLRAAGATQVSVGDGGPPQPQIGTVPQGFAAVLDPTSPAGVRMVAIPGGPEDTAAKDTARAEGQTRTADIVLQDIGRAIQLVEGSWAINPAVGLGAETAARLGGTNAADYRALVDTISANVGFDRLTQMRAESPTGGALGAISDTEMRLLSSVLGSLSQSQSPAQASENLKRLQEVYRGILEKARAYPNAAQYGLANPAPPPATAPAATGQGAAVATPPPPPAFLRWSQP